MLKPYHYLMVTLASAAITVACAPPNAAKKPVLGTTNAPAATATTPGGSTGGATTPAGSAGTGGSTPTGGTSNPGTTTPPAVTPPGVGTGTVVPPVSETPTRRGSGRSTTDACDPGTYTQVERLARPAINEGLVRSNNLLNAFNSIPPTSDLITTNDTVTAVQNQAVETLRALSNDADQANKIVAAFLPDLQRIDVTVASGYAANPEVVDTVVRPASGRLLTDDVIDISLRYVLVPKATQYFAANVDTTNGTDDETELDATTMGFHSDFVDYVDNHRDPQNTFPYLVPPN